MRGARGSPDPPARALQAPVINRYRFGKHESLAHHILPSTAVEQQNHIFKSLTHKKNRHINQETYRGITGHCGPRILRGRNGNTNIRVPSTKQQHHNQNNDDFARVRARADRTNLHNQPNLKIPYQSRDHTKLRDHQPHDAKKHNQLLNHTTNQQHHQHTHIINSIREQ